MGGEALNEFDAADDAGAYVACAARVRSGVALLAGFFRFSHARDAGKDLALGLGERAEFASLLDRAAATAFPEPIDEGQPRAEPREAIA